MPAHKKHATARARMNKATTAATLSSIRGSEIPAMPEGTDWHAEAVQYWNDSWASEMSAEWLDSDYHNVVACTFLWHDFWTAETARDRKDALGELRLQRKTLGLDPISRRSLEWTIENAEAAKDHGQKRRGGKSSEQPNASTDPRLALVQ